MRTVLIIILLLILLGAIPGPYRWPYTENLQPPYNYFPPLGIVVLIILVILLL